MAEEDHSLFAPLAAQRYGRRNPRTRLTAEVVADSGGERTEIEVLAAMDTVDRDFRVCHQFTDAEFKMHIQWALEAADDDRGS